MLKHILIAGAVLAAGTVALQWLEFQYLARSYPVEIYIGLVGAAFLGLGVWIGARGLGRPAAAQDGFVRNDRVIGTLGVSERELEVLEHLAAGRSNKEIAGRLNVSPNTVKTHVSRLFEKLEASRRTEAIAKARELGILP